MPGFFSIYEQPVYLLSNGASVKKYVVQAVCGLLLLVLLLGHQPVGEKSKVITYKGVKRNKVLKTMKSVQCSHSVFELYFLNL